MLESVEGLRKALDQVSEALASPSLDKLLKGEAAIERALAELPTIKDVAHADRAGIRVELEFARAALLRCRRLGASLTDLTRATLDAQGRTPGYGRKDSAAAFAGRALNTRA